MFKLQPIFEEKFTSFEKVLGFVAEERKRISRVPLKGMWAAGARFHEDEYFGGNGKWIKFNEYSLNSISQSLGINADVLQNLKRKNLASDILNDLMETHLKEQGKLSISELVYDEHTGIALGNVSEKYVGYSNDTFTKDILICLDPKNNGSLFPTTGSLLFKEAYSINSRFYVRLTSKVIKGTISGRGGDGEDVSEIGVELSNSMAGGHAAKLSWYVFRLLCANGLIANVGGAEGRVIHSGTEESFRKRLNNSIDMVVSGLGKVRKMIETLGDINFDPDLLALHTEPEYIFSIIPGRDLKTEALKKARKPKREAESKKEWDHAILTCAIKELPFCIGGDEALKVFRSNFRDGATMYDFINIFTEHAKSLPLSRKIEAETRAGDLAAWIAANKRKFV